MLTADQYFEMGENFRAQNNLQMAVQMYNEVLRLNPGFGLVHVNMAKILAMQGNVRGEYDALKQFMNCNLTPLMLDLVQGVKQRLADLEKQFTQPIPVPPK